MTTRRQQLAAALDAAPGKAACATVWLLSPLGLPTALLAAAVVLPVVAVAVAPLHAAVRR